MREWTLRKGLDVTCPRCKGIIMGNRDEHDIVVVGHRHERPRYYHRYCYLIKLEREMSQTMLKLNKKHGGYTTQAEIEKMAEEQLAWQAVMDMVTIESWSE